MTVLWVHYVEMNKTKYHVIKKENPYIYLVSV